MNSKYFQDQTALTNIGVRLRQAENIGLSQQAVAKQQLCAKLSTVRDLKEDHTHPNIVYTFLRSYISSDARLLNIPEESLIPIIDRKTPIQTLKKVTMKSLSSDKIHRKQDSWLIWFT